MPLPYSAAVGARFPDPATLYETPGLIRNKYTSARELSAWLRAQADSSLGKSTRLGLVQAGSSQQGQPIEALIATRTVGIQPAALNASGRPTVMIVGQQYGDEPAGAEALLVIARELAPGGLLEPLLDRINVVLVPRANPDGAAQGSRNTADGTDLDEDHLLLRTPEARALAALTRDYRPMAVLDLHEYPAMGRFVEKYHAIQSYDSLLQYSITPNLHEFVAKAEREWYAQPLRNALTQAELTNEWYYSTSADLQDKALSMGSIAPTNLRNTSGLKNSAALTISSRGSDLGRAHIQRRVHTLVTSVSRSLLNTAERAKELNQVQTFVARDTASMACRQQLVVQARTLPEQRTLTMLQPDSGADINVRVDWNSALQSKPTLTRPRPCGYWLSANALPAVEKLRLMGLQVLRVAEAGQLIADSYNETRTIDGNSGYTLTRGSVDASEGSFYVSLNQPLANLAAAALEPDNSYSYAAQGLLPSLGDLARVITPPSVVFEEEND
ncbi:M14 family metallopeptidase [Comamonas composti]|uniref:M14 family metallopeptidase n=1 Tax=Comamonas composti TaxID=408558 RepID=UPI001FE1D66D|nr:M14 family metallocarboxypeptidase [Comamonas composti]